MKFWRTTGKIAGQVVNVRADRWIGLDYLKTTTRYFWSNLKELVAKKKPGPKESFNQASLRLGLTPEDLILQERNYRRLAFFFVAVAATLLTYSLYIALSFGNIPGLFIGLGLTLYTSTLAFRYHLWFCQIKHKKLGLSFSGWIKLLRENKE